MWYSILCTHICNHSGFYIFTGGIRTPSRRGARGCLSGRGRHDRVSLFGHLHYDFNTRNGLDLV